MNNKIPALIISKDGITSNYTYLSLGFIKWEDIRRFEIVKIYGNEITQIHFNNKKLYIDQVSDANKKMFLKMFTWIVPGRISIPASGVTISTKDLKEILTNSYNIYLQNKKLKG